MVVDILCEEDKPLVARLAEALRLLEDDSLGGGGSRGSGQVKFDNISLRWRNRDFYSAGGEELELLSGADLAGFQSLAREEEFAGKLAG